MGAEASLFITVVNITSRSLFHVTILLQHATGYNYLLKYKYYLQVMTHYLLK